VNLSRQAEQMVNQIEEQVAGQHREIDHLIDRNQWKVIEAFQKHRVSDYHFAGSTGYGYNDRGRETLDLVYADIFGAEAGIVRPHFASGTHTIATALFGVLRPGDKLLFITGTPYDTLHKVIGKPGEATGSLHEWGIGYDEAELLSDGTVDWDAVERKLTSNTKVIGIQRSRGYAWRKSFGVDEIGTMINRVKQLKSDVVVFVDNCYGEFTEHQEPTEVGADLIAGSLIKNPGGGLVPSGGYIVGKRHYVELAANRLIAPGIGMDVGAMLGTMRALFQGIYLAPHTVGQALKGAVFAAALFEHLGYETNPSWREPRSDIIQAIRFVKEHQLIDFVQGIQRASAVDAHVVPVPWAMPGYVNPVIMAAGTFIQGGSLELSADAPIREPFIAYMQGGLTYSHAKLGVLKALEKMGASIFCD
jgi:cystathionine beta-lyase family protein involved in aluminum resistance